MDIKWKDGFSISVSENNGEILISANREGLLSLAGILEALAEEQPGSHIHLDASILARYLSGEWFFVLIDEQSVFCVVVL